MIFLLFFRKNVEEDRNKKKGFCECCCVHYEDLDMVSTYTPAINILNSFFVENW